MTNKGRKLYSGIQVCDTCGTCQLVRIRDNKVRKHQREVWEDRQWTGAMETCPGDGSWTDPVAENHARAAESTATEESAMSTNYYAFGPFPGGEADGEGLHIGQAAGGSRFLFRAHPEQGITSLLDWRALLHQQATSIRAEHGVEYTPDEMIEIATQRRSDDERWLLRPRIIPGRERPGYHVDPEGFEFCAHEFC